MRIQKLFAFRDDNTKYVSKLIDGIIRKLAYFWQYEKLVFSIGKEKEDCVFVPVNEYVKNRMDESVKAIIIRNFFVLLNQKKDMEFELWLEEVLEAQRKMVGEGFSDLLLAHCFNYIMLVKKRKKIEPLHLAVFVSSFRDDKFGRESVLEMIHDNLVLDDGLELEYYVKMLDNDDLVSK